MPWTLIAYHAIELVYVAYLLVLVHACILPEQMTNKAILTIFKVKFKCCLSAYDQLYLQVAMVVQIGGC